MRLQRRPAFSTYFLFTLLPSAIAINLDCSHVQTDDQKFDFSKLGGPKTVTLTYDLPPISYGEIAFTIDICKPLKKTGPKDEDCPNGTRGMLQMFSSSVAFYLGRCYTIRRMLNLPALLVCGYKTVFDTVHNTSTMAGAIPIAGDYSISGVGGSGRFDPKWTRLKTSDSQSDRDKEGMRLKMGGGKYQSDLGYRDQKAVVEFLCDRKDESGERKRALLATDESDDGGNVADTPSKEEREKRMQTDDGQGGLLKFIGYALVGEDDILSLEWRTKYACEDRTDDAGESSSGHWGFFTWFIIM